MTQEDYLKNRLENQLTWYNQKSQYNQRWFKGLRLVEILCASLIPFLSGMGDKIILGQWFVGGLGVLIAVAAGALSLNRYQERWVEYRTVAERLKREEFTFLTGVQPYDTSEKFPLLVDRVESILASEHAEWLVSAREQCGETDR